LKGGGEMDLGMLAFIFTYAILPNLYYRNISNEVVKRAPTKDKLLALTFDDGPDPKYTPKLLDVLQKNGVKCTFFVLAERALKYPHLIRRMVEEGHHVGLHSLKHMNPIFRLPNQTKRDFEEAVEIMKNLGVRVRYFRPPWGIFNPVTFYYAKAYNFKVILWSIHAADWSRWTTVECIADRLINKVKPGDIVLLHDSRGAPNAPERTIKALEIALPKLKEKGYSFMQGKDL
jgi:peptidoglycan-N-acetylglucosamine deacetylase